MVTAHYPNQEKYLTAKSTDTKPTAGVADGTALIEIDTGKVYFYDESAGQWLEAGSLTQAAAQNEGS
ncbi:MAG: hypothetical protein IKI35_05725 [Stomatobaculum sp.]|nr:hypothetical protein [Stomatobaculum sp.]